MLSARASVTPSARTGAGMPWGAFGAVWQVPGVTLPAIAAAEALRFVGQRLTAQAAYWDALAECRSLADVAAAQASFVDRALGDYRAEASILMGGV